jgi:hypothetical protein
MALPAMDRAQPAPGSHSAIYWSGANAKPRASARLDGVRRSWVRHSREQHSPSFIVLYWPLGLSVMSLAAIRHAFVMPAEWKANWLFRLMESHGRNDWMNAVERFILLCVIAPIHLASLACPSAYWAPEWLSA